MIERTPVASSHVSEVAYDRATGEMVVTFRGGERYGYEGVRPDAHYALVNAASVGEHFHRAIKGRYGEQKL